VWLIASRGIPGGGRPINLDCVSIIEDMEVDGDHWGLFLHVTGMLRPVQIDSFLWNRENPYEERAAQVKHRVETIMTAVARNVPVLDLNKNPFG